MQNAAFQDVCFLAQATGPDGWRRKMVFAQDSGEAWQQIGTVCMDEVSAAQKHLLMSCHCHAVVPVAHYCAVHAAPEKSTTV